MIIDIHTHLAYSKIYPKEYLTGMFGDNFINNPKAERLINAFLKDKYGDKLIKQMDEAGINKSVLLAIDGSFGMSKPEFSLREIYRLHSKIIKRHPNRFLVFAGIDPRRGEKGISLFKKGVKKYGFKGMKLYPPMGYYIHDERLVPYYRICNENNLSVLIHGGDSLNSLKNEYAEPRYLPEVAKQFPGIKFILAHLYSYLDFKGLTQMLELPNIYLDISGFQILFNLSEEVKNKWLNVLIDKEFNKKILFGSDWPLYNIMHSLKDQIDKLKNMFSAVDPETRAELLDNILFNNAKRVLY